MIYFPYLCIVVLTLNKSAYNNAKIRKYIIFHIFKDKIFSIYTYLTYLFRYCHLNIALTEY